MDGCVGGEENGEWFGEWMDGPGRGTSQHTCICPSQHLSRLSSSIDLSVSLPNKTVCSMRAGLSLLSHNFVRTSETKTWSRVCAQETFVKEETGAGEGRREEAKVSLLWKAHRDKCSIFLELA